MKNEDEVKEYRFWTYEFSLKENVELPVYYADHFFKKPSTEMNSDLMAFALGLELSSGLEAEDRSSSVLKLLREIGCDNARVNAAFNQETTIYSTDVAIGSKQWKSYTIIFVVLNGAHYNNEAAANVMLGASGNHAGFMIACNAGLDELRSFIKDENITGKTKILITGYSRTAAGANLLAAYISDAIAARRVKQRIGDIKLTKKDCYGFSFETPLCGHYEFGKKMVPPTDSRYDNIWYVTNPDDPVTYVPTKNYNFVRYGHHYLIDSHNEEKRTRMLANARYYFGEKTAKKVDMSKFKKVPLTGVQYPSDIFDGYLARFFSTLGTRDHYHEYIESDFVRFVYVMFDSPDLALTILINAGDPISLLKALYSYSDDKEKFDEHFRPLIESSTESHGYGKDSESILNAFYQIAHLVRGYFKDGIASIVTDKYIVSATVNMRILIMSHLPSMTYCYIIQESPYYQIPAEFLEPVKEEAPDDSEKLIDTSKLIESVKSIDSAKIIESVKSIDTAKAVESVKSVVTDIKDNVTKRLSKDD